MTWFKVDDSFYDHPKSFDAPDCAVALWVRAGTWSARNLTEGFVPSAMLARLCGDPIPAARDLVRRGLWHRTSGGYQFHDWTDYQPTKAQVEEERKKNAERQKRWREAQRNGSHNGVTNAPTNGAPDPTRPLPSTKEGRGARSPASRRAARPPNSTIPLADQCPEHPGKRATNCGLCRSDQIGRQT